MKCDLIHDMKENKGTQDNNQNGKIENGEMKYCNLVIEIIIYH